MIRQDRCAMKVCTDSCILGAWTAKRLEGRNKILDIGTGTGLLPLMLAQKSNAGIDTIESDIDSSLQAGENIRQSPWKNQIHQIQGDARLHLFNQSYDFIITNPPFFESGLQSPDQKKNKAKHDQSLTLDELMPIFGSCLKKDGLFSILLPFYRTDYFELLSSSGGFFLKEKLIVRQTAAHKPFRSICLYSFQKPLHVLLEEINIKDERGKYSVAFSELMSDYY